MNLSIKIGIKRDNIGFLSPLPVVITCDTLCKWLYLPCGSVRVQKVRKQGRQTFFFFYLQKQTSLRPILSTWFCASITQTDMHKILSRRASQFVSAVCLPWNKQMGTDNPCDSPYVLMNRIHPRLLCPPPMDFTHNTGLLYFQQDCTLMRRKEPDPKDIKHTSKLIEDS